ncbi:DinB family protein [Geothrix sp. PMB-07]|uniref:DinB family protein n=1 Tax=Geothrix sp. PMB-07 TaxID=3068640 RepID=UPI002741B879|nr:DinB family protein [Geothrix sp. PMB-07]WLT33267.1 DinB family protein [Geothrix sp. PMB-07]
MERGKLWRTAFGGNVRLLELNQVGLTEDLAARRRIVKLLGGTLAEDPAWEQHYARGGPGETAHLEWAALVTAFKAIDQDLKAALQGIQDWDRPTLNPALGMEQSLEQVVAFLYMHECYHLGQIGLIRKLHGLPGAI